jgi:hypothetical protein
MLGRAPGYSISKETMDRNFLKKKQDFFLKKEAKTFYPFALSDAVLTSGPGRLA